MDVVYAAEVELPTYSGTGWRFSDFTTVGDIFSTLLKYILPLAGIVLLFMLIMGGIGLMTAAGDPKKMEASQGRITMALVGFLIIFISYFIVQLVEVVLGVDLLGGGTGSSAPYSENDMPTCNGGNGYVMCSNDRIYNCNTSTGSWVSGNKCPSGTTCNEIATECVTVFENDDCVNGTSMCENGDIFLCFDGDWDFSNECLSGECNNGGNDCMPMTCTSGNTTREVGKYMCVQYGLSDYRLSICGDNGEFTPSVKCPTGCINTGDTAVCRNDDGSVGMNNTIFNKKYL